MKTIKSACQLQPKALEINVGDQIERLDEIIQCTSGQDYFKKTFITAGMKTLLADGRIKVLKNRRLPGLNHQDYTCVPSGTILPSDWFDNLVCGVLDLSSPRVVLP